jgi:hypothetical protein
MLTLWRISPQIQRSDTELRLVPTVSVGMPSPTLCVVGMVEAEDAERPRVHSHGDRGNELNLDVSDRRPM